MGMSDMEVVFLVIALIGLGVGLISVPIKHPPFWLAKVCFTLAAIIFSARWVMWGITTDWSLWPRLTVMAIIGAFALIGVTEGLRWINGGQKANREVAVAPAADDPSRSLISQSQFAKISQLEEFIGGKDEWALRSLFDLPSVLQKNLITQNIRMNFIRLGKEKEFSYNNYSANGSCILWVKEGHFTTAPSGVLHIEAGPKDVLFLVTTEKFQAAQKQLIEFMNSALIPQNIKVEISAFNVVLNQDAELMMHVMDERMHQDENFFLHNMDMGTSFYGVIATDYARKIIPLKPAADRVLSAIATTWKINQ